MNRSVNRLLPILLVGMFVYSGCAKQGIVKNDAPLVPVVAKSVEAAPQKTAASMQNIPDKSVVTTSHLNSSEQTKSQPSNERTATTDVQKALEKIYFDFDASTLSDTARQTLTKNSAVLRKNPETKIRIEGHCDERGSDEYNLALGERRAQAAVRYLTALGLPADRLSAISYGKEKPADPGHDENGWAKNRRDEFVIMQ
jgi:peptidoglycan-associated lipoprotein